jgi:hypothetical protein
MSMVYFTIVAIILYVTADWLLERVEVAAGSFDDPRVVELLPHSALHRRRLNLKAAPRPARARFVRTGCRTCFAGRNDHG